MGMPVYQRNIVSIHFLRNWIINIVSWWLTSSVALTTQIHRQPPINERCHVMHHLIERLTGYSGAEGLNELVVVRHWSSGGGGVVVLERLHAGRQRTLKSPVDHGGSPVYEAIKYFDEIPNLNQKNSHQLDTTQILLFKCSTRPCLNHPNQFNIWNKKSLHLICWYSWMGPYWGQLLYSKVFFFFFFHRAIRHLALKSPPISAPSASVRVVPKAH